MKNKVSGKKFTQEELDKLERLSTDLPGLLEYAHTVGGAKIEPTEKGAIKSRSMTAMYQQTSDQYQMLIKQMKLLAEQAQELKDRVSISEMIYACRLSFQPVMGKNYFLFSKESGEKFLSLISPEEWTTGKKVTFIAEVTLLSDHTWKVVRKVKDDEIFEVKRSR